MPIRLRATSRAFRSGGSAGMHMRDFFHPDELPEAEERIRTLQVGDEVRAERWFRCCNRRYTRVRVIGARRLIGGYRAEYVPITGEQVDLPARLPKEAEGRID